MNLAIGAIDQIFSLAGFLLFFLVLEYIYSNYRLFTLEVNWLQWVLAYIAVDFVSYWYHRLSHEVNFLWAGHITHHSSDHYNYSNGFRLSPFQGLNRILFYVALPLIGFSPLVLVVTFKISGIFDFFQHTQHVPKLGFLEKIFITPSIHRVHHGKNDLYLDKNYGSNFVIWDKLFGTYQEETEPVVYGITNEDYVDDNPVRAIFFHYDYLWNTMKSIPRWRDKIKLLFMPPSWKPDDLDSSAKPIKKENLQVQAIHRQYAFIQLFCCIIGIISLLAFKDFLTIWIFLFFAMSCIIGMVNSAMTLNNNINSNFRNRELARLLITGIIVSFLFLVQPQYYLLFVLCYLLTSLILASRFPMSSSKKVLSM
ncbi:MAG: hypothetical protein DHS20C18_02520 [Saprospiraceae bacterium]|nr:MAG: hypothetical protein DHS20C18_02520 [Saprospiraceae bacterium]